MTTEAQPTDAQPTDAQQSGAQQSGAQQSTGDRHPAARPTAPAGNGAARCPVAHEALPPEFFTQPGANPYPAFTELREQCPVRAINHPPGAEAYVVADYETISKLFGDPRISKSVNSGPKWFRDVLNESSPILIKNMLTADPPEHTRLRKLVSRAFVPRRMELLRPRIQEITDELIDAFPETGEVDLFNDFALALPMKVICEFLGVPVEDRPALHEWGLILSGAPYADDEANARLKWASENTERYLLDLLAQRRENVGEDLVSSLIRATDEDVFTNDELVSTLILLIIAGHKTTANLIGNGTQALLQHPDQFELLKNDPGLVDNAIEEFLRYEGPVYRGTLRLAAQDMEISGVPIAKESFVHLLLNSANRDPEVFEEPDRLDITRQGIKHFAFGHGAHFCPGAPLSRVEGQVAFTTLLRRLPGLALAVRPDDLEWVFDNSASRGLAKLPVTYDRRLPR